MPLEPLAQGWIAPRLLQSFSQQRIVRADLARAPSDQDSFGFCILHGVCSPGVLAAARLVKVC